MTNAAVIERLYRLFNTREIYAVLAMLTEDVLWANGMDGGHVQGREGVRAYWTRQWSMIDPSVEPAAVVAQADGVVTASVHQVVKDLQGAVLSDGMVAHMFQLEDGRIRRFDIR